MNCTYLFDFYQETNVVPSWPTLQRDAETFPCPAVLSLHWRRSAIWKTEILMTSRDPSVSSGTNQPAFGSTALFSWDLCMCGACVWVETA